MSSAHALGHPFLRSPELWEQQLPDGEAEALRTLEDRIDEEIGLAPFDE